MSKSLYIWVIVAVIGVFCGPVSGLAMNIGGTEKFEVIESPIAFDTMPIRTDPARHEFVVTPEPVTITLFGLGLLGLIKLKNTIN